MTMDEETEMTTKTLTQEQAEDRAWTDAYRINVPGAANPAAVAHTLAEDLAMLTRHLGTRAASRHPAILTIYGQLAFLLGKSLGPEFTELDAMTENAKRLGIYDPRLH
jgi:hypothetical protein